MIDLLLRYVNLAKEISNSINTDQFSTQMENSKSRSIGSYRESDTDSLMELMSLNGEIQDNLEDISEELEKSEDSEDEEIKTKQIKVET